MQDNDRIKKAKSILAQIGIHAPEYLGHGCEGVVFHDNQFVYKVYVNCSNKTEIKRRISFFLGIEHCQTLYTINDYIETEDAVIIKYPYEPSTPCVNYTEEEAIIFLTECFQNNMAIRDCKPHNFIRAGKTIRLVDMEACNYMDNLFLNMCIRMYVYIHYFEKLSSAEFQKLKRSAINNFDLPELEGVREFVNKVYSHIIYAESLSARESLGCSIPVDYELYDAVDLPNLEQLFYAKLKDNKYLSDIRCADVQLNGDLYFEPKKIALSYTTLAPLQDKVTLLIKTCAQDEKTIEANIKHIVKQLSSPNPFYEIVVSIDTKQSDFLRQYNAKGSLERLIQIIERLKENKVIDRYVIFDASQTEAINERCFGLASPFAYTATNIPVTPQLYAFEQCQGDYILQMDSDVIIGRKDMSHLYLTDMLNQLKRNKKVISVGFNIYNHESKAYFGFENGGFVPEVRLGLFDKKRFFSLRPYPNELDTSGRLKMAWHRSVELFQKQTGYCSIRGGDNRTFYIHPQNYRKKLPYAWMTMHDRVEQLQIPAIQYGGYDCEGSYYDWCHSAKREEKMVIVSCFRNVSIPRFLRFWCSLMSQTYQDFGVILYDDNSDNGLPVFIQHLIKPYQDRITFVSAKYRDARMANVYRSIHYYCSNPESIIVMVDGDDALIGKGALQDVWEKYDTWGKDLVLGRVHQTYRLQPHYRYPANFYAPRENNGGNVYQHLKTFKKYLFDSIPLTYFKFDAVDKVRPNASPWFDTCDDYAMMIPMVEMSSNPLQMDDVNYFYERDYAHRNDDRERKECCIAAILNKPKLNPNRVFTSRQKFRPDFERIEIDITYDCNLKCIGCNRSCAQAPTKEQISMDTIEKFIADSVRSGKKWQLINVLGGEPTLHKDFQKIIEALQHYADTYSPDTIIKVVSNGITAQSRQLCEEVKHSFKNVVIDYDSYKTNNKIEYFSPFNDAPVDDEHFAHADFTNACWVTAYCGIGLNARGYYACAACGGIDRVLNGQNGAESFELLTDEKLQDHYRKFCSLCGNFKHYQQNAGNFIPRCEKEPFRNIVSKTWQEIYKRF